MRQPISKYFSQHASEYYRHFSEERSGKNFLFRRRLEIASQLVPSDASSLLDCACGSGEITRSIITAHQMSRATLVDITPSMLALAKESFADVPICVDYIASDIFDLKASQKYDVVLCLGLLAHVGRAAELLTHLGSFLKPDGALLLQSTLLDNWNARFVRILTDGRYYRKNGYRLSHFFHRDILIAARAAGLSIQRRMRFGIAFPFADRCCPRLNYLLEKKFCWLSRHIGAEAIYLLSKARLELSCR